MNIEVITHFSKEGIKIISFSYDTTIYNVISQAMILHNNEFVKFSVETNNNLTVELTLIFRTLQWKIYE